MKKGGTMRYPLILNFVVTIVTTVLAPNLVLAGDPLDLLATGNHLDKYEITSSDETFQIQLPDINNELMTKDHVMFKKYYLNQLSSRVDLINEINHYIKNIEDDKKNNIKTEVQNKIKIGKDIRKSLSILTDCADQISQSYVLSHPDFELMEKVFEISDSINLNYQSIILPRIRLENIFRIIGGSFSSKSGERPVQFSYTTDQSAETDPDSNTFWQKPKDVSSLDLTVAFNRKELPDYSGTVFQYDQAKTGHGVHPGFKVKSDGVQYKIRLGTRGYSAKHDDAEYRVGPFATRILFALGYNSLPIDTLKILRVKYDRRLLSEYNMRAGIPVKIGLGKKFNIVDKNINKYADPFANIYKIILKDGSVIDRYDFKLKILIESKDKKAALNPELYNSEFEETISEVQYKNTSIEKINDDFTSVGPWDWNNSRHIEHKELRGYALLAAWLGQFDARVDNTRLYLIKDKKNNITLMRNYITDVGSGLGATGSVLRVSTDNVKKFKSKVLKVHPRDKDQVISKGFQVITTNKTFESMTAKDAKWMLGYIDQLSEKQIKSALEVSGFEPIEVDQIYQKLMQRKENIRQVLAKVLH